MYFEKFSDFINYMKDVNNYRIDVDKKYLVFMWKFVSNTYVTNI